MVIQTESSVSVQVVTINNQVITVSDETGLRLSVSAIDESGVPMPLAADGTMTVQRDHWIALTGRGLRPNSTAVAWVFSEPRRLGTVRVGMDGTYAARFRVPDGLPAGDHTTQVNGIDGSGKVRSVNLAIQVIEAAVAPESLVSAAIASDPTESTIVSQPARSATDNGHAPYVLVVALLLGGALFVINGMRLKQRDIERMRRARRLAQRRAATRNSFDDRYGTDCDTEFDSDYDADFDKDGDITGEILLTR
jgi:hypothetical protein